jgi:hypothetical protein
MKLVRVKSVLAEVVVAVTVEVAAVVIPAADVPTANVPTANVEISTEMYRVAAMTSCHSCVSSGEASCERWTA